MSGSPRIKGNTEILVQEALKAAFEMGAEQEFIQWMLMQNMIVVGNNYGMGENMMADENPVRL
jgi:multimeric flavodoxin WrbA